MTPHAEEILRRFWQIDQALTRAKVGGEKGRGFPPTSPWWHRALRSFYTSGRLQLIARVGRRGGKSSTLCRLAVCEAIYGKHEVPAGDRGIVAIVSARRPDALARLRTIRQILDALKVPYTAAGDTIELTERPITFQIFTASIAGVSGFTSIFVLLDEVSKWRDKATGANPADVVIESIVPTTATMPEARVIMISSPMGLLDAHAKAFAKGDTDDQLTVFAPSWEANPTLTPERCRKLARGNEIAFQREYGAIPQAEDELSLFDGQLVELAARKARTLTDDEVAAKVNPLDLQPDARHRYVAVIDPATRGNAWTLIVACLSDNFVRKVCLARDWVGTKSKPLVPGEVFAEIRRLIEPYRTRVLYSDQFSEDSLREIARTHDLVLVVDPPWSAATKADAYEQMRTLFQERRLEIPDDPQVKTDVLGVRQKIRNGSVVYELAESGSRHSDYAPAIGMACLIAKVPPAAVAKELSAAEQAHASMVAYLNEKTKARKQAERRQSFGRRKAYSLRSFAN